MGVKSKIEQAINRARREGRVEDVTKLRGNLAALKKQRGDAAWARANTYKVKPGDSFFSIAGSELGSERWVQKLLHANPGVNWLTPGMEILLPSAVGDAPSISQTDFDALKDYLDPWGKRTRKHSAKIKRLKLRPQDAQAAKPVKKIRRRR